MKDFPWTDQKTLAKEYAQANDLDLAETEKKMEEERQKVIYETDPISDPSFESSDSPTDI